MKEELWKDIPGYEGLYQASTLGRIRSLDFEKEYNPINRKPYKKILKGRILKPFVDVDGYKIVILYKDGNRKTKRVHRLVAIAFLKNPMEHEFVKFKDDDITNTELDNLMWVSSSNVMIKAYQKRMNRTMNRFERVI